MELGKWSVIEDFSLCYELVYLLLCYPHMDIKSTYIQININKDLFIILLLIFTRKVCLPTLLLSLCFLGYCKNGRLKNLIDKRYLQLINN